MAGLGAVNENERVFLSVAGGYIWNRKGDPSSKHYATQTYQRADGTEGVRTGTRFADLTGKVTDVYFKTHEKYGESINVAVEAEGEMYVISISTNNRFSQDMMKALLAANLSKELYIKPYDFIGENQKRAQGISFRQDGVKVELRIEGSPQQPAEWFKSAGKKQIKRFFEDLNDWFVQEVSDRVIPMFENKEAPVKEEEVKSEKETEAKVESPEKKAEVLGDGEGVLKDVATPLQMKKHLKAYIKENYDGESLPTLSKAELIKWYKLSLAFEELPFDSNEEEVEDVDSAEVPEDELDAQLDALMGK